MSAGESQWEWVGIALRDVEGNTVAWELVGPDGHIQWQQMLSRINQPTVHQLTVNLRSDKVRTWNGHIPNPSTPIAQYPPLPIESGE